MQGSWESAKVVSTGEFEDLKCDLVRDSFALVADLRTTLSRSFAVLGTGQCQWIETFLVIP